MSKHAKKKYLKKYLRIRVDKMQSLGKYIEIHRPFFKKKKKNFVKSNNYAFKSQPSS